MAGALGSWSSRGPVRAALFLTGVFVLAGCAGLPIRTALPEEKLDGARPYGIESPFIRLWADRLSDEQLANYVEHFSETVEQRALKSEFAKGGRDDALVLSGGGPDGAFGAGILRGWSERGDRPEFSLVTGVSTGAIIALFAFLGPEYDDVLEEIYTNYSTDELVETTILTALTGGIALTEASGFRALIERYVDAPLLQRVAEQHRKLRGLFIITTNLDAARPMIWNIGEIAASGHPDALTLVRDIIQASAAIPGIFPPVLIPVEADDGRQYDEMHVDGGATRQIALLSPQFRIKDLEQKTDARIERWAHVIINNNLRKRYTPVRPRALPIVGRALSSLISGSGDGDIYRLFAASNRDGGTLRIAWVPETFDVEPDEVFDPVYMRALYALGREAGRSGDLWTAKPPGF